MRTRRARYSRPPTADLLRHPDIHDFEEQVLFITDNILDQFAANHSLVTLISKHSKLGVLQKFAYILLRSADAPAIYTIYESLLSHAAYTYRSPELMFYMILELVSGTSYNAILYQQPVPLEELKAGALRLPSAAFSNSSGSVRNEKTRKMQARIPPHCSRRKERILLRQDSPPAAGRFGDIIPLRRSAILPGGLF